METLQSLLESLQEELLSLYEKNSNRLADQIMHWHLMRKEQVLLYWARKNGVTRIGMTPVPTLAASQAKAKEAIEQELHLQSLSTSRFGSDSWTLPETSRERFLTEPKYCFKKKGEQLNVRYDDEEDNLVRYTLWGEVYYQDEMDVWQKASSGVNGRGIYYEDNKGLKNYYIDFKDEATKYATKTGKYEVLHKLTKPAVFTSAVRPGGSTYLGESEYTAAPGTTPRNSTPKKKRPPTASPRRKGRYGRHSSPRIGSHRLREGESPASPATPAGILPPSPGEVGGRHKTTPRRARNRLTQLILDARDPPVIVLKGDPNSLKCLRFRFKKSYSKYFFKVSTTWTWTDSQKTDRLGKARILVAFVDDNQRDEFLKTVPLPKSVQYFTGSLNGL
nr:MAG: early protein 2 [Ailuropoda melanoleuca papillomavirus 5]